MLSHESEPFRRFPSSHARHQDVRTWGRKLIQIVDQDEPDLFYDFMQEYKMEDPSRTYIDGDLGGYMWSEHIGAWVGLSVTQLVFQLRKKKIAGLLALLGLLARRSLQSHLAIRSFLAHQGLLLDHLILLLGLLALFLGLLILYLGR